MLIILQYKVIVGPTPHRRRFPGEAAGLMTSCVCGIDHFSLESKPRKRQLGDLTSEALSQCKDWHS